MFLYIRFAWILVSEDMPGHAAKVLWQGWWLMPVVYLQVAFMKMAASHFTGLTAVADVIKDLDTQIAVSKLVEATVGGTW